jgi:hypothetical protein
MADANIKINIETQSLDQLNAKLTTLQAEIKKVPVGSAEFKKLSAEIRKVDGAVEGANKKLKALDVGQLAGNFAKVGASVASASALFKQFGDQGSDSNKQIQDALEATNTILGAAAIAEGVAAAGEVAFAVATEGATVAQEFFAAAVGTSTGALAAFKVALITTGIGALIVGLGLLISAFMDSADAAETNKAAIDDLNKSVDDYLSYQEKLAGYRKNFLNEELKRAELQKKSDKEVFDIKNRFLTKERDITIATQKQLGKLQQEAIDLEFKTQKEKDKALAIEDKKKRQGIQSLTEQERGYYERLLKIRENFNAKNDKLAIQRGNFDSEIAQLSLDAQLEAQKKSEEAAQKAADKAKERRDKLKSDLDEITNILKEQSVAFSLQTIAADYTRITGILDGLKGKTADYKAVLKSLEKEGFKPLADVLRNTFGKDAKANLDEIRKAIDAAFSKDVISNVTGALEDISTKLQNVTQKNNSILEETVKTYSTAAIKPFELISNSIVDSEGQIKESVSSVSLTLEGGLLAISSATEKNTQALKDNALEQIKAIQDLVTKGLLTPEQAKQFFDRINSEYDKGIKAIQEKGASASKTLVTTFVTEGQKSLQQALDFNNEQIAKAETEFIEESFGKGLIKRLKLEKEYYKTKYTINAISIANETNLIKEQQTKLENLKKDGLITEEEYANQKEDLEKKLTASVAKQERLRVTEQERRLQEGLKLYQAYFEELKKYYELFATSLQALGNIEADQAALRDLQFEEEIQKVGEVYDARFKLIDEEEKRLDELEQAKETNLTASERKRRALAKERATLEAQQESELAQLENDRANAAADAAIKQANLNFALATGQIAISTAEAIIKAVAESPLTFGLPFSAFAAAAGAIQLAAANSARTTAISQAEASRPGRSGAASVRVSKADGGLITGPGNGVSDSVPANLSNGEFVVNANATQRYLPLLTQLNQSGLQGGNPVNPSGGNNEMVGLLRRLEEKLSQPSRAYVVATDIENIQNKQNYINRRSNVL